MFPLTRKRLAWLATCLMFVACASSPEVRPTKKKKKKKRKTDEIALKKKKDKDEDDEDTKPRKKKDSEDEEVSKKDEDKPKKVKEDDEVVISDTDESEEESSKSKKKKPEKPVVAKKPEKKKETKKEEAKEEDGGEDGDGEKVASRSKKKNKEEIAGEDGDGETASKAKKKKKEEIPEEDSETASKAKKKKEEIPEEDGDEVATKSKKKKKEEDVEEVAAKPPKKKEETKLAAKAPKKKDKEKIEEEVVEEPVEEPEPTKVAAKPKKKDKKKQADVDMTSGAPETIDMESDSEVGQEPERVEDQPPDRRGVAIAVPGVDSDSDSDSAGEEPTPVGANPLSINERPLVLGESKLSVHGGLRVNVLTVTPAGGMATSTTSESLALGVNYGVSASAEVGLDYAAGISPGSAKGPITLHGAYSISKGAKLDAAIAAGLALDFSGFTDPVTMQTTSKTYVSLQLGAWARYRVARKASIFTGIPATPATPASLSKLSFALPPLPYQLAVGFNNAGTIALDLPVGVGYQGSPKLYVFGMLDLAHIRVANTANAFVFKDFIPLTLGGFYAMNKLDIGVQFSDDLKQGFDYLRFETLVRYSIK